MADKRTNRDEWGVAVNLGAGVGGRGASSAPSPSPWKQMDPGANVLLMGRLPGPGWLAAAAPALVAVFSWGCASVPVRESDLACLRALQKRGVRFSEGPSVQGIRTPVTLDGDRFTPRLVPRDKRPAHMDCQLAMALLEVRPVFRSLGIDELEYSAAYTYRNRRRSNQLSAHAFGLAIDVHTLRSPTRDYVVARSYERRRGRWQHTAPGPGWYKDCVGRPRTADGRTLRRLACRLRLDDGLRLILTPDDDRDHHDHFHLEAHPDGSDGVLDRGPTSQPDG
jgi:hypothetical protein